MDPTWIVDNQMKNEYNQKTIELGITAEHYQLQSGQDIANLIQSLFNPLEIKVDKFLVVINLMINYKRRLTIETKNKFLRLIERVYKKSNYLQSFYIAKEMLMS